MNHTLGIIDLLFAVYAFIRAFVWSGRTANFAFAMGPAGKAVFSAIVCAVMIVVSGTLMHYSSREFGWSHPRSHCSVTEYTDAKGRVTSSADTCSR